MKRALLAPSSSGPAFGYAAQFPLPADFLRLVSIDQIAISSPRCRDFRIEGRNIVSAGTVLPIVYVCRADESTWDAKLVELMTARMLWKLAYPVTQSTTLRDELKAEYAQMARMARSIDSQENPSEELSDEFTLLNGRM